MHTGGQVPVEECKPHVGILEDLLLSSTFLDRERNKLSDVVCRMDAWYGIRDADRIAISSTNAVAEVVRKVSISLAKLLFREGKRADPVLKF